MLHVNRYVQHQVHLADRRHLLRGRHISRIQEAAIDMLMVMESKEKADRYVEDFKLALVTHDPKMAEMLYPTEPEPVERVLVEPEDISLGNTRGAWEFAYDPEEAKRVLESFLGDTSGTMDLATAGLTPMDDEGWL